PGEPCTDSSTCSSMGRSTAAGAPDAISRSLSAAQRRGRTVTTGAAVRSVSRETEANGPGRSYSGRMKSSLTAVSGHGVPVRVPAELRAGARCGHAAPRSAHGASPARRSRTGLALVPAPVLARLSHGVPASRRAVRPPRSRALALRAEAERLGDL